MADFNTERTTDITTTQPDIETTLEALKAYGGAAAPDSRLFYGLSGLMSDDLARVRDAWDNLAPGIRHTLLRQMIEASESNIDLDYRAVGFLAMEDDDPRVREAAIELLWEDETLELMYRLIDVLSQDKAHAVRAAAATALGRFILEGELGHLPAAETVHAQNAVVRVLENEHDDVDVRRRALEAIANCSHTIVPDAIRTAYKSELTEVRASAVFAMGRTCDSAWNDIVLTEIESPDPELRYEAARAAGELELVEAVKSLSRLAAEDDREIQEAAIWSLGEIGGKEALRVLSLLAEHAEEAEDDVLLHSVEDAIDNVSLGGDFLISLDMDD
jgi:HEAT repeat protein